MLIRPDPTLVAAKAQQKRRLVVDWKPPTPEELRKGLRRAVFTLPFVTLVVLLGTLWFVSLHPIELIDGQIFVQSSSSSFPISGAIATEVARGKHTATPQEFVEFALPYARRAHDTLHWPVSVILAQWGLVAESCEKSGADVRVDLVLVGKIVQLAAEALRGTVAL